jgi:carbon-monoxide dehydrogenase medium subunit
MLNLRLAMPPCLVDIGQIPALTSIEKRGSSRVIGACVTHATIEDSVDDSPSASLLSYVASTIAYRAIRNRGTIGGSLAHSDPAAELPAVCLACDASLAVSTVQEERTLGAADFFIGLFSTALAPNEILTSIRFPAWPAGRRSAFLEIARRAGDFAIVGVALTLDLDARGRCSDARIVVFGAAEIPQLIRESAQALRGAVPDALRIGEAARIARMRIVPRSDHHASAEYRSELVEVLTRRALERAAGVPARLAA